MNFSDWVRPSLDVDFIATMESFQRWVDHNKEYIKACYPVSEKKYIVAHVRDGKKTMVEFEIAWPGSSAEDLHNLCLIGMCDQHKGYVGDSNVAADCFVAPPSVLLLLKTSHRYLKNNPHFLKTMIDVRFLRQKESLDSPVLQTILKKREKETYVYKHPNLMQKKKGFFDASVKYVYDHDTIHQAVKLLSQPAYEYYKSEDAEVFCSKEKFFAAPLDVRFAGVYEEACVLALERSQIPFKGKVTPKQSFMMALEKVCTSITSGFFREFAWENYDSIMTIYQYRGEDDYVKRFEKGLAEGIVKVAA